ncbi:hypothetical protein [Hyphomonas sp.]|uniref:hypothetical protein n=1 Tax=Hyphomonas sp. TaxID=87 RepID=UPI00391DFF81
MAAASAVAMGTMCLPASAQLVPLEIEGPMTASAATTPESGTITAMGQVIFYDENTVFATPTSDKTQTRRTNANGVLTNRPLTATQWLRGENFEGRNRPGFLNGTVIVTGYWDPALNGGAGGVYAEEIFSDIAENVILGVITANQCTNPTCTGPDDFIQGNGTTPFVENKDQRLPAEPILDGGLFELNLTGANLVGTTFGGEGYYSDAPVHPRSAPAERALVYWDFQLGDFRPDLLLRPNQPEISVLRIRCNVGDRLEVRGWVHQPINSNLSPAVGTIRATMSFPDRPDVVVTNGTPTLAEATVPRYGIYRLRGDVPACADDVKVEWIVNGLTIASADASVDRLRGNDPEE